MNLCCTEVLTLIGTTSQWQTFPIEDYLFKKIERFIATTTKQSEFCIGKSIWNPVFETKRLLIIRNSTPKSKKATSDNTKQFTPLLVYQIDFVELKTVRST